jgi:hypothetical protein
MGNNPLFDSEPPVVQYEPKYAGWRVVSYREAPDPLYYMGNGTWLLRSTIQELIDETGYLCADPVERYKAAQEYKRKAEVDAKEAVEELIGEQYTHEAYGLEPGPKDPWTTATTPTGTAGNSGIDGVLAERGSRYGDFTDNAFYAQSIKEVYQSSERWDSMPAFACEALDMIASKISRILSGDPSYPDNWIDIQGFAKLAEERFKQEIER